MSRLAPDVIAALAVDKPTPSARRIAATLKTAERADEFDYSAEYRYQCLHSLVVIPSWLPVGLAELAE